MDRAGREHDEEQADDSGDLEAIPGKHTLTERALAPTTAMGMPIPANPTIGSTTLTEQALRTPTTNVGAVLAELLPQASRGIADATPEEAAAVAIDQKGVGDTVDSELAARVGGQTGADVSGSRIHKDPRSRAAARAMQARAFAHGSDIFLGPGESEDDPELIGHELTHVAQQTGAVQRKVQIGAADSPAEQHADQVGALVAAGAPPAYLIIDAGPLAPGQMYKRDFILGLRAAVVRVVEDELGKAGATAGCPYLDRYFSKYAAEPARVGEDLLRRWLPGAKLAHAAGDIVPLALEKVREAVRMWNHTGRLPSQLAMQDPQIAADIERSRQPVQQKSLQRIESELGPGQELDANTAARMSRAVGADVSGARVHSGEPAQRMAAEANATAFAVGQNVVLGARAPTSGVSADVLLAHELAHTAQQKDASTDPVARKKPIAEEDAAAENDAGIARLGNFAGAVGDVMRTGLQLQRCPGSADIPGLSDRQYYIKYLAEIAHDAAEQLKVLPFATYDPSVNWTAKGMQQFALELAAQIQPTTDLESLVRPELVGQLIVESRVVTARVAPQQGRVDNAPTVGKGPEAYFPSVGIELGNAVARRTAESLRREVPRYAQARIAAGGKEPAASNIPVSHPIDELVVGALTKGNIVAIDTASFKSRHPDMAGAPKLPNLTRPIKLTDAGMVGWYRLESPLDATPEEIAHALTGSATEAFRLTIAHPLYGLEAETRGTFATAPRGIDTASGLATSGGPVAEEAALAQAGPVDTKSARSRVRIMEQMRLNASLLRTSARAPAKAFGLEAKLEAAAVVIDERLERLAPAPDSEVAKWDVHTEKQADRIAQAARGLEADRTRLMVYKSQAEPGKDFDLPHDHPLFDDAVLWATALMESALVKTADEQILVAARHSLTLEVEILERGLSTPQALAHDAKDTTQTRTDFQTDDMGKREIEQRKRLGQLRAQMLADPKKIDPKVSAQTTEETRNLIFESQVAMQAAQLEQFGKALEEAADSWMSTLGDVIAAKELTSEGKGYYTRWQGIFKDIKKGEKGDKKAMEDARKAFEKLSHEEKFQSYLTRARDQLKTIQNHHLIVTLIAMVAITVVSMGAGAALSGFLGGTALVVEGAEIVVGGIGVARNTAAVIGFLGEVATFTFLANRAFSKDHSVGALATEFAKNLIMFGAMRGIAAGFKAAGLTKFAEAGKDATKLAKAAAVGGDMLGQSVLNGGVGVMMAWVEQKVKEALGAKPMTEEEVDQTVKMAVAQAVIFTIGGRMLESPLQRISLKAGFAGKRWQTAMEGWALERKANAALQTAALNKTIKPEQVIEAAHRDQAQIQKELDALEELKAAAERDPAGFSKNANIKAEELTKQMEVLREHQAKSLGVELAMSMKELDPNHYECARADSSDIISTHERLGSRVILERTDPDSGARTFRIEPTGKDALPFWITEKMPDWALTPSGKRVIEAAHTAHMKDSDIFKLPESERVRMLAAEEAIQRTGLDAATLHKLEEVLVVAGRNRTAVEAVGRATPAQLTRLAAMAGISPQVTARFLEAVGLDAVNHTLEAGTNGQVRINGELEIHPARLDDTAAPGEITNADLQTILNATRGGVVDQAALQPFSRSGAQRLRFRFQLAQNEAWLTGVLDRIGKRADPAAQRILTTMDDSGRTRLNESRTGSLPRGVDQALQNKAAAYALDRNPANAREFVDRYEMFTSEYMRVRKELQERITKRTAELRAAGTAQRAAEQQASREALGAEVQGFGEAFNRKVLEKFEGKPDGTAPEIDVVARARELNRQLAGRFGARSLGKPPDAATIVADVRKLPSLQFGSESSGTYHPNKHGLPSEHAKDDPIRPSPYNGLDQVSRYLRSANETIQMGTPNAQRAQDGGFSITFDRAYSDKTMRAIVRVDPAGNVVIATYGDTP